ncbi:Shr3 [Kluyveromyces lactis]|nr:Shr3 [Kluyveromyces lactis]
MGLTYKDFCAVGTALIIGSTTFLMGIFFSNQPYDYNILFNPAATPEHFENALKHYQTLFYTAKPTLYMLGAVAIVGVIGSLIRVYKPNPDLQLFEYGSLALYVLGICVFLTNIKTGVESAVYHNWGEVSEAQGIAVVASSNIIILIVFAGVLVLQGGLWYSTWEYEQRLDQWRKDQLKESAANQQKAEKATEPAKKESKKKK